MRNIVDASKLDLKSTIVNIRRVAKTVKGGRNMRFSVTVVVGDGNGYVGVGLGKSQEGIDRHGKCLWTHTEGIASDQSQRAGTKAV